MKMNNEQMLNSLICLSHLEEKGVLGFAIAKNRKKIAAEVQEYSQKRDELLKEYGTDIGEGKFQLLPENATKFFEALKPFGKLTVDVPVMRVTPEVFCSGNLTTSMMETLDWMVED